MKKVALMLSSKPGYSETFIKELINGLKKSENIELDVYYGNYILTSHFFKLFIYIFRAPFYYKRVINYYKKLDSGLKLKHKLWNLVNNLNILTTLQKYDYIHYGFANLIHNRAHLGAILGAKTSISLRGYDITFYPINHPNCFSKTWNYIDKIQYNSTDLYELALYWGANKNMEAHLISAAVNDDIIQNIPINKTEYIKLLSVGRLHWKKGFDTCIYAVNELVKKGVKVKYKIIGDGIEKEQLKYLIYKFNLNDVVEILHSAPNKQIIEEIDNADLILIPSIQEGCSNVALEAQGRGRFCIVSDAEGMNEVIEENVTGFIFSRNDYKELANLILSYNNLNDEKKAKNSEYAVHRIKDKFSRSLQIVKWHNFFQN